MSAMSGLLRRYDQGRILKAVFYGLVVGVAATLAFDYRELARENALAELAQPDSEPILPGLTETGEPLPKDVETSRETLRQQLAVALEPGGSFDNIPQDGSGEITFTRGSVDLLTLFASFASGSGDGGDSSGGDAGSASDDAYPVEDYE